MHKRLLPNAYSLSCKLSVPSQDITCCCAAGHLVSGFVKQHLPILLVQHLTSGLGLKEALTAGFLEVDAGLAGSNVDCEFSGSTCSLAHLKVCWSVLLHF
jgi:hypothetical protein